MQTTLSKIYRYPIKSMGGHTLSTTQLTAQGVPGDRCWTLKDEERGGIKGGKRFPQLMSMSATLNSEPTEQNPSPPATITLPDGRTLLTTADDTAAALSEAVGAPISIWPLLPADQIEHYQRAAPDPGTDMESYLREVFARTAEEPLPDLSAFPPELMMYESPPGTYFDAYPLLIISLGALQALQDSEFSSLFDVRRFRPNLVVDTGTVGFDENQWQGKSVQIGDATLSIELPCPRCVMTTHACEELPKDPKVMRALVQLNEGNLGIYANVTTPGKISVGDPLIF